MKKTFFATRAILLVMVAGFVITSCDTSFNPPPTVVPILRACQISNFLYVNAVSGNEGFPEIFTSPMQNWNEGMTVLNINGDKNPVQLRGEAQTVWEFVNLEYNAGGMVNRIAMHAFGGLGTSGPVCQHDTCEKDFIINYDNNNNPVKITGEVRDFYGALLSTFPVCDNEFDPTRRLIKQTDAKGNYWRFEYTQGNLSKMYFKSANDPGEQLRYQFLSYDNAINYARTNAFWQLYYNTYSNNNPTAYRHYTGRKIQLPTGGFIDEFIDVQVKYKYGANFGTLPTEIEFDNVNTGLPFYPNYPLNYINYQCQPIVVPGG